MSKPTLINRNRHHFFSGIYFGIFQRVKIRALETIKFDEGMCIRLGFSRDDDNNIARKRFRRLLIHEYTI